MSHASQLIAPPHELAGHEATYSAKLPNSEGADSERWLVSGELLVVIAGDLDRALRKVKLLTWVTSALTVALGIDVAVHLFIGR